MAFTLSLFPTLDSHQNPIPQFKTPLNPKQKFQSFSFSLPKLNHSIQPPPFSTSHSPSSDPPSSPQSSPSLNVYDAQNQSFNLPRTLNRFLTNEEFKKLQFLDEFTYSTQLSSGCLTIRAMKDWELDMTVELLAESFAESMFLPDMYLTVLGFLIKQYLVEKRGARPHAVTLIGFYRGDEDEDEVGKEEVLAGTVEISFDKRGANASPPTPTPPKECPYICNMTVKKELRRRGIGWHLLKASEELISYMSSSRSVYLHCRMIDSAPFSMYKKAGYDVVKTDSVLVLLMLQRRKHLMRKEIPALRKPYETVNVNDDEVLPSMDRSESESLSSDQDMQISPDED